MRERNEVMSTSLNLYSIIQKKAFETDLDVGRRDLLRIVACRHRCDDNVRDPRLNVPSEARSAWFTFYSLVNSAVVMILIQNRSLNHRTVTSPY
ncbi:hypothetical protein EVAR_6486_1 [Eumeta japonica]|uniref:Uncharacterized protein n=1 Tax=Eumeta variegata TaxID=151549 RepID=A0A4C1SQ52_EUMVA|nr:hypothetical protein EVAR_6486_1 [Eumeta japonica]